MKKFHFDLTAFGRARRPQRAGRAALVAAAICAATAPSPSLADAVTDTNEVTAVVAGWQSAREAS